MSYGSNEMFQWLKSGCKGRGLLYEFYLCIWGVFFNSLFCLDSYGNEID